MRGSLLGMVMVLSVLLQLFRTGVSSDLDVPLLSISIEGFYCVVQVPEVYLNTYRGRVVRKEESMTPCVFSIPSQKGRVRQ